MLLKTKNFGEIEIADGDIIYFNDGIPGFETLKKFIIIENPDEEVPFHWLQSVEESHLAFVIINPFLFKNDYDVQIPQGVVEKLEISSAEDVLVYSIVVIPEDISKMTANLKAPLVINNKNRQGKQLLLDVEEYQTRHYILDEMKKIG